MDATNPKLVGQVVLTNGSGLVGNSNFVSCTCSFRIASTEGFRIELQSSSRPKIVVLMFIACSYSSIETFSYPFHDDGVERTLEEMARVV